MKPTATIQNQGTVTICWVDKNGFVVDTPDGMRQFATTKIKANKIARDYFKKTVNTGCVGVGTIEWINEAFNR